MASSETKIPKDVLLFLYNPKKTFVHVVVKIKDTPGALADVARFASDLGLNLVASFSASHPEDGSAVWSFFAECSQDVDAGRVRRVLAGSPFVIEAWANKSEDGLLVDQMHYPLRMTPNREFIGLNTVNASSMFRRIVSEFGSGGAVIIYEEGLTVGKEGGAFLRGIMGREVLQKKIKLVGALLSGWGWGKLESIDVDWRSSKVRIREVGSFEAAGASSKTPICHFTRGMLAGLFEEVMGARTIAVEESCMAQGAPACEFVVTKSTR